MPPTMRRDPAGTIREVGSIGEDERSAFECVTSTYEREAFAPDSGDEGGTGAAIDAAGELVDRRS